MQLIVNRNFSKESGRWTIYISLWSKERNKAWGGMNIMARDRLMSFEIRLTKLFNLMIGAKKCIERKKAYMTGESPVDFCEVQRKLIERRRGKKLGMNAHMGEDSTVQEW